MRLVETVQRGPCPISGSRGVRQRHGLAVRAAPLVQADDPLEGDVEQVRVRPLGQHHVQRAVRQLLNLTLRDSEHRNVRIRDRPTDRVAVRVEPVTPDRALRVQLTARDDRHLLGLRQPLAHRQAHALEPPPTRQTMPPRVHLIRPVEERPELRVHHVRPALQRPRPVDEPVLDEVHDLRPQRRPRLRVQAGDDERPHPLHRVQAGAGVLTLAGRALRRRLRFLPTGTPTVLSRRGLLNLHPQPQQR